MRTFWLVAGFAVSGLATAHASDAYNSRIAHQAWRTVAQIEKENQIPRGLLHSMSLVETGQGMDGHVLPWPYTVGVNPTKTYEFSAQKEALAKFDKLRRIGFTRFDVKVGSKGRSNVSIATAEKLLLQNPKAKLSLKGLHFSKRFENEVAAARFVKQALRRGYDNVDVGLLQINWHYHGDAFASVEEAFDPAHNAGYAVSYLTKHRQERNWWDSVGRYHSGTQKYAKRYIQNVYAMYRRVHRLKDNA